MPTATELFDGTGLSESEAEWLQFFPETLWVHGLGSGMSSSDRTAHSQYGSESRALAHQSALETAADNAETEFPSYFSEHIGGGYAPVVEGQGRYVAESFDLDAVSGRVAGHLFHSRVDRITVEIDTANGRPGAYRWQSGGFRWEDGEPIQQGASVRDNGRVWVGSTAAAQSIRAAYESALSTLKANRPEQWDEFFGFTEVAID
jgi:hypothetical protein